MLLRLSPRWGWMVGGLLSSVALAAAVVWQWARHEWHTLAAARSALQAEVVAAAALPLDAGNALPGPSISYVDSLPRQFPAGAMTKRLQSAAAHNQVQLLSLAAADVPPTAQTLGVLKLSVVLRGSYAASKMMLAQLLQPSTGMVLQKLAMRRLAAGQRGDEVETTLELAVLTQPADMALDALPVAR